MKILKHLPYLITAACILALAGCVKTPDYDEDPEYSDIPWNSPQDWEGSRSIPGMTPNY